MKRLAAVLAMVVMALPVAAQPAEWSEPTAPRQVFGNTYWVGTQGLGAILVASLDGHVLIDGALPGTAPLILESIRALGFDPKDVRVLLNSHAHYDHAGSLAALQAATGAPVMAPAASAGNLRSGQPSEGDPQFGSLPPFPGVASVQTIADGDTVRVGNIALVAHLTEAHTPGGTTWSWESCVASECRTIVYGDSQSTISVDGFRFSDHPEILKAAEHGFLRLESMACDILITPHPAGSSFWERIEGSEPLVDPNGCRRYAASARQALARRVASEGN